MQRKRTGTMLMKLPLFSACGLVPAVGFFLPGIQTGIDET